MSKPRLTSTVLDGLITLAGIVEAGSSNDILGYEEDQLDAQGKKTWANICRACEWIRAMQTHKETQ